MEQVSEYQQQTIDFANKYGVTLNILGCEFKKHFPKDEQARNVFKCQLVRGGKYYTFNFGSSLQDSCKPTSKLMSKEKVEGYLGLNGYSEAEGKRVRIYRHKIETDCPTLLKLKNGGLFPVDVIDRDKVTKDYEEAKERWEIANKKAPVRNRRPFPLSWEKMLIHLEQRVMLLLADTERETVLLDRADNIVNPSLYDVLTCLTKYDPGTFENFCGDYGYDEDSRTAERTYKAVCKEWAAMKRLFPESDDSEVWQELQEIS